MQLTFKIGLVLSLLATACSRASPLTGIAGHKADQETKDEPDAEQPSDEADEADHPVEVSGAFLTCAIDDAASDKVAAGLDALGCTFQSAAGLKSKDQVVTGLHPKDPAKGTLVCAPATVQSRWQIICGVPPDSLAALSPFVVEYVKDGKTLTLEHSFSGKAKPASAFSLHAVTVAELNAVGKTPTPIDFAALLAGTQVFESVSLCSRWCAANGGGTGRMIGFDRANATAACVCAAGKGVAAPSTLDLTANANPIVTNCSDAIGTTRPQGPHAASSLCNAHCLNNGHKSGFAVECNMAENRLDCSCVDAPAGGAVDDHPLPVSALEKRVSGTGSCDAIQQGTAAFGAVAACHLECVASGYVAGWLHDCDRTVGIAGCTCVK